MTNQITYDTFQADPFIHTLGDDETKGALPLLTWAYETYGDHLVYACSFGAESMVLIHLISQVKPDAQLVFLDTDLHFQETYELIERVKRRYPKLQIEMKKPDLSLRAQSHQYQPELWRHDPNLCCYIRKIKPLEDVLNGAVAWISGLRRAQSESRAHTQFINQDERFKSIKVCPLIYWTEDDVWNYIHSHHLPYNTLHDENYPSIGCMPCTSPVFDGQDSRAGRWQGTMKTECGLHSTRP
ncbi:phosphoadenylyl-sulfate reductase [Staphylococcus ratti]|uniref:Adenosine 5'-phosphosulfate reductase n=1 Tax=Staphylococcus ratti TaxID=2892440 RepID=A0ABY3PDH0_9STAP|nr:phosphoadenylyl-sulfate reductase [Staphylococcus ratti]UEX90329.1 phosphoadenylyl-sulfate reductase [Staphylococcus ratti]